MTDTAEQVKFPGPDEIEGFWAFDKMHAPRPLAPLSQDLVMSTLAVGFTKAQAEYDCPIVASNQAINHYFYMAFHPHPDDAVVEDRMSRYLDTLDEKVPLVGKRWTNEWLPMIRDRNEAERTADYSGLSNAELLAKFDDMKAWMTEMWYIHGHINFALVSGAKLSDFYADVMHPDDPTEAYQILQGHHTRPVDAAHGLWRLSRVVRESKTLHQLFDDNHPRDLAKKLAETDEGRAFLEQLERVPLRLRMAQRRRLRHRRRAVAGEPVDPAGQHRPLHQHARRRRPDDPVRAGRQASRGSHRQDPGQARRRPGAAWPSSTSSTRPPSTRCR